MVGAGRKAYLEEIIYAHTILIGKTAGKNQFGN
jgi:hypothetical protein